MGQITQQEMQRAYDTSCITERRKAFLWSLDMLGNLNPEHTQRFKPKCLLSNPVPDTQKLAFILLDTRTGECVRYSMSRHIRPGAPSHSEMLGKSKL